MPAKKETAAKRKTVTDLAAKPPAASQSDPRTLAGQKVICSAANRPGRWKVEEDEGGKVVCISRRVPPMKTWVDRLTLTIVK